jgi:hypothetical protein
MSSPELPADLAELEARLERRARPDPPAGLRERVLAAVRREGRVDAGGFWRFAAAVAAAAVLLINLSMSAANDTDWGLAAEAVPVGGFIGEPSEIAEAPEREDRRQALLARGRARLTPGAPVSAPSTSLRLFSDE